MFRPVARLFLVLSVIQFLILGPAMANDLHDNHHPDQAAHHEQHVQESLPPLEHDSSVDDHEAKSSNTSVKPHTEQPQIAKQASNEHEKHQEKPVEKADDASVMDHFKADEHAHKTMSEPSLAETPADKNANDAPAALQPNDQGNIVPVSLLKGKVSNQRGKYVLGPGDHIDMKIQDLDKFNQVFSIRPDGYASVHPFGELYISGTDVAGLEKWLEEKFKFYLLKPKVTLDVKELRPALIYVSGAVRRPGVHQFIRQGQNNSTMKSELQEKVELTLSNVLKRSGGVTLFADVQNITVRHPSNGHEETFNILDVLLSGQGEDIWLLPGDEVRVPQMDVPMDPETFKLVSRSTYYEGKFPVIVLGAVGSQGEVAVNPSNNSLNAAIALAGGFATGAKKGDIVIQRPTNNGGFNRLKIDRGKVNVAVQPGDVVYVAKTKLSSIKEGLRVLSQMTQPFFFSSAGLSALNSLSSE